ncbi:unnamed protein product [Knipowitschia caucasica]
MYDGLQAVVSYYGPPFSFTSTELTRAHPHAVLFLPADLLKQHTPACLSNKPTGAVGQPHTPTGSSQCAASHALL